MVSSTLPKVVLLPITRISNLSKLKLPPTKVTTISQLFCTTTAATYAGDSRPESVDNQPLKTCYGGSYAGHVATFSPTTAEIMPLPIYYVPKTLIKWGQVPSCFELLTSEDIVTTIDDGTKLPLFNRTETKVLPAVGCEVDNLNSLVEKDSICLSSLQVFESNGTASSSLCFNKTQTKFVLETIFVPTTSLPSSETIRDSNQKEDKDTFTNRIRVSLTIEPKAQLPFIAPIKVTVERKNSYTDSEEYLLDSKGLTGSIMHQLIGDNTKRPFSDTQGIELNKLAGRWKCIAGANKGEIEERAFEGYWSSRSVCTLSLPGNVIIQYRKNEGKTFFPWAIKVSFIEDEVEGNKIRRIIQRTFDKDGTSIAQYREERKEREKG